MSLHTSHVIPAPRIDVWEWHTRPGAVFRLTPPFLPLRPIEQATSLAKGTTVFALPAGLRWEARHDLSGYIQHHRFTDVCINAPVKSLASWRHIHDFTDHPSGTLITDTVHTRAPRTTLSPAFAYRQHQLINDIQAQQRFYELTRSNLTESTPLTIGLTGSRGLVGRALTAQLTTLGHTVVQLVRGESKPHQRHWDPAHPAPNLLEGLDALIHLAGEPILGRFNDAHKADIRDSRIEPTRQLSQLVQKSSTCHTMVSASAIGYYGHARGDEILDEESTQGDDFLAGVCEEWEAASRTDATSNKRIVNIRTGVVMSGRGGMLPVLKAVFSVGLGGPFRGSNPWMSWIAIDDLCDIYIRAVLDPKLSGAINAVAPNPIKNQDFVDALAKELKRPAKMTIPSLGPAILLGQQGAKELALADQRVQPRVLNNLNHYFRYVDIRSCLAHELGGEKLLDI